MNLFNQLTKIYFLFLVLILVFLTGKGYGQQSVGFDHLTVENGLSQSGVRSITQDSRGFMWFGTRDGLNRYDGRSFEIYRNIDRDSTSISSGLDIYALLSDKKGRLWAGTIRGLNQYLPETNSFERYFHNENDQHSLSDNEVKAIADDSKGDIWVGTSNGLNRLTANGKFQRFYKGKGINNGIAGNSIQAIYKDKTGNLWIGTTQGLTKMSFVGKKYQYKNYFHQVNDAKTISNSDVRSITEDDDGNLWIGTHLQGFSSLNIRSGEIKNFSNRYNDNNSVISNIVRKILYNGDGKLWIATLKGISIYDLKTEKFSHYRYDPNNNKSLNQNSIYDIFKDKSGSIWVGTFYGGASVYHPNATPFKVYRYNSDKNSISGNVVGTIVADKKGNLWIGTEGEGLNRYNTANGQFISYKNNITNPNSISSNLIKAISIDKNGKVWIGSHDGGLDFYEQATDTFGHYKPNPNRPEDLFSIDIYSVFHDSKGRFWVGTFNSGLYLYSNEKQGFSSLMKAKTGLKLQVNYINSIFEDSKGTLWVSTAKGLYTLKANSNSFEFFGQDLQIKLGKENINFVQEDSKHQIWIGTYQKGLIRYANEKQTVIFTKKEGLPSANVLGLLEDKTGNLWISTSNGLSKYDGKTFKNYTVEDGLPGNVFNNNSYYKDGSDRLYFGAYTGMITFDPAQINENDFRSPIYFTSLKLFNQEVQINDQTKLLNKSIGYTKSLDFAYDQNVFTIEFALLNYTKSEKNRYSYKLDGFDRDWNETENPSASYSNLASGNYTLFVKAANNDGIWSNKPIQLSINITPPFWKTWWAYLFYAFVFSALLFFVIRFFSQQEKLKAELYYEHLNNEAIKELYQSKMDFFTRISHEIRTPLTLITAPVENISENSANAELVYRNINTVKRSTDRLLKLINELLDFRKLESGEGDLNYTEVEINSFCIKIQESFAQMADEQRVDFDFLPAKHDLYVAIDEDQIEKVLYNLITNSFKNVHKNGKISLSVIEDEENFVIEVFDNGVGIAEENFEKIFGNFFQAKTGKNEKRGWGIGLPLVKVIVEKHNGKIELKSNQETSTDAGFTNFSLIFPKKPDNRDVRKSVQVVAGSQMQFVSDNAEFAPVVVGITQEQEYTILLVEDNEELRTFIKDSLTYKYRIIESINGKEGVEQAMAEIPDIIISDVDMPLMNGFEFAKVIKTSQSTSHIPIIMLTAFTTDENRLAGLEAGVEIYLTKPFNLKVLKLTIDNMISAITIIRSKYAKQILLMPKKVEIQSMDEKFLEKCMVVIEDNLNDQNFNVAVLVDKIGMSQTVLYKKLKALTDLNITDFIKSIRLKRAAQLLTEKKLGIADIAYAVGFNDRKYFSKEFKKQYHLSPTEYSEEQPA